MFTIFFVNLNAENNWTITIPEKYQEIETVKKLDKIDAYKKEIFFKIEKVNEFIKQNQTSSVKIKLSESTSKQKSLLTNKSLSASDEKPYAFTQNLNRHKNILYTFDVCQLINFDEKTLQKHINEENENEKSKTYTSSRKRKASKNNLKKHNVLSIRRKLNKINLRAEVDIIVESNIEILIKRRRTSTIDTNLYKNLMHHVKDPESPIVDRVNNNLGPDEEDFLDNLT